MRLGETLSAPCESKSESPVHLSLQQIVWLFPIAYALHVMEELPNFTTWAQRFASPSYTMREYLLVHATGLFVAILSTVVISITRRRVVLFVFFTFIFSPAVFFNILFHAGATIVFRAYCPGVITAECIYAPLFFTIAYLALRDQLLTTPMAIASFVVAGIIHTVDVAYNVFKAF